MMDWEDRESQEEIEKRVIENYQNDERMMILIFAQWCINNDIEPKALYDEAYPGQLKNHALIDAMDMTVPKGESELIDDQAVLNVLQLFGNDDLAFSVQLMIEKRENKK